MLIAFDTVRGVVVAGPETLPDIEPRSSEAYERILTDGGVRTQCSTPPRPAPEHNSQHKDTGDVFGDSRDSRYECVVCGEPVTRNRTNVRKQEADQFEDVFRWFEHTNRDADCFGDGSMGASHRAAVELSARRLARASRQLTRDWISDDRTSSVPRIEPERRVTAPSNDQWIETDLHLRSPPIAVEVFSEISQLDLSRRLTVLFDAGYDAYLVFDVDGRYNPSEIEVWLQDFATVPVRVGRFDKTRAVSGDLSSLTLGTRLSESVIDPSALTDSNVPVFLQ
ncbi:hypothetical protein SAMN05216564_1157 [Halopenitus persicus]|uniref:Restriction endonuclease n=1 Tax=Halopenitus persicus TaxID=1048396 RepID=A0A1H3NSA1_9EURY|nr:hypothetical protein SAMN05216564_1157 [Halopenitus persicus]